MGLVAKRFEVLMARCFPLVGKKARGEIQRVYYAGALDIINLLSSTKDGNEEEEVISIMNEVRDWCNNESARIMDGLNDEIKKRENNS